MAVPDCKLLVWSDPPRAFLKIVGKATAPAAPDFVSLLQRLQSQGHESFVFELSSCLLIDSTFVGHLAQLALHHSQQNPNAASRIVLVNPAAHITELLDTIFVLDLFQVIHDAEASAPRPDAIATDCANHSRDEVNQCCLEAHRFLAALAPDNAAKFEDVIRFLEQNIVKP